jgi:hypothetical protein
VKAEDDFGVGGSSFQARGEVKVEREEDGGEEVDGREDLGEGLSARLLLGLG